MKYDELVKLLYSIQGAPCIAEAADAITTLQAELEQCRKDAERYRFIRDEIRCETLGVWKTLEGLPIEREWLTYEDLDAAIDKAMESV